MESMKTIATIRSDFPQKFGIPRQSALIEELRASIIFEKEFRDPNCVMGLEEFSHIWILWEFSENKKAGWSPTVIPPRLGGKVHKGVFATRSPFRPNPIGLSCVRLESIEMNASLGPILQMRFHSVARDHADKPAWDLPQECGQRHDASPPEALQAAPPEKPLPDDSPSPCPQIR